MASNLPVNPAKNINDQLDENMLNNYFTSVGTTIQSDFPSNVDENFLNYMPDNNNWDGFCNFSEVTENIVEDYIKSIANDKSITDSIPIKIFKVPSSTINRLMQAFATRRAPGSFYIGQ